MTLSPKDRTEIVDAVGEAVKEATDPAIKVPPPEWFAFMGRHQGDVAAERSRWPTTMVIAALAAVAGLTATIVGSHFALASRVTILELRMATVESQSRRAP